SALFILTLYCHRAPLYLHSFPTRRSSDLLLSENVIPHTFFNYIFLNKKQFEKGEIPSEVMLHEQTHAIQKHSLDVIFVEFLQIRSEEHTSELQSRENLVCRLLLEKKISHA